MEYTNQLFELELQRIQNENDKVLFSSIWKNKHIFLSGELRKHLSIKQDIIYSNIAKIIGGSAAKHRRRWNYIRHCHKTAEEAKRNYCYNAILQVMYSNRNVSAENSKKGRVAKDENSKTNVVNETNSVSEETSFNTALERTVWEHFTYLKESFWSCNICLKEFQSLICGAWVLFKHLETQHVPNVAT